MSSTIQELADLVNGVVEGDGGALIAAAKPLGQAGAGDITFVDNDRDIARLARSSAAAVVIAPNAGPAPMPAIRAADPRAAFIAIAERLHGPKDEILPGVDSSARVHPTAAVGADVCIEPFAVVGAGSILGARCRIRAGAVVGCGCRLGDDVTLHPHVVLYDGTSLGNRVVVHANSVIGADGFGYRFENGQHKKVPQLGSVEIGDDVEIGACTTIDRGTFGATRIGAGTKIDNLVMVAHNCQVGRHNILISQMGMAGSSSTGDYVTIAGQVGVVGHVNIGDRCTIGGQAAITKDVPPGSRMLGSPATPEQEQKRMLMALSRLPELKRTVRRILKHLGLQEATQSTER